MAQKDLSSNEWKSPGQDSGGNPFGWLMVGEGGSSAFSCLVLNIGSVSWYYWPSTVGAMRYGITEPTVATQDSAGEAI